MQTVINKVSLSDIALDYRQSLVAMVPDQKINGLFMPLTEKGLDRLTDSKIEHIICTSALAAFF